MKSDTIGTQKYSIEETALRIKRSVKIIRDKILEFSKKYPGILEVKDPFNLFSFEGFRIENDMKISYIEMVEAINLAKEKSK
jgi:hypothetical protein